MIYDSIAVQGQKQLLLSQASFLIQLKVNKTLILDLDETLVHSSFTPIEHPQIILPIQVEAVT